MRPILQTEASECGLACLATVACFYGNNITLSELRARFSVSLKGATLEQLARHSNSLKLATRPVRLEVEDLIHLRLPAILHWNLNHFVVLESVDLRRGNLLSATLIDPASGRRKVGITEISERFTGVAMELFPTPAFEKQQARPPIPVSQLTGPIKGMRRAIFQLIALAGVLEVFTVISPLFNQFVTDDVIVTGDRDMLKILVMSFALMFITQSAISIGRSWFIIRWSREVNIQWTTRVFFHLIHLPLGYFEKRRLGDITSRFGSVSAIQSTLTNLFVESLLDGLMTLLSAVMMIIYSRLLFFVVIGSCSCYVVFRWVAFRPFQDASRERLVLAARENSHFLETIRAILPLKLFGRESERQERWLNLREDVINRDLRTQRMSTLFRLANTSVTTALTLAMFYLGANEVLDGAMTVGMLFAFNTYAGTFSSRFFSVTDTFVNVKMLNLHTDRLSDIVLEPIESMGESHVDINLVTPDINLLDVKFRYAEGEPYVFDGVRLQVPYGQSIALIGPSGCGKTTLCKLILGLHSPSEGTILLGDVPISRFGLSNYRRMIGTVMQDDVLLSGSVSENISFYSMSPDEDFIHDCARASNIHDEIMALPMGYQTLIGELGSTLSGGQKQRVLLARALYKKPTILVLDEATSHLDIANEHKVNAALGGLKLTKIVIAHRPETILAAQRIVELKNGKIFEISHYDFVQSSAQSTAWNHAEKFLHAVES